MERFEIQAGRFKDFEDIGLLLRYGEMFLNCENDNQELLIGVDYKGNWEKIGGKGTLTFCGTVDAITQMRLFSGDLKPITGGIYKLNEDLNLTPEQVRELGIEYMCDLNDPYTIPELNKGDLLLYGRVNDSEVSDGGYIWIKIGATITSDVQAKFDPHSTNFESRTVYAQQALTELDREKIEWGGTVTTLSETVTKKELVDALPPEHYYEKVGKIYQVENTPFIYNGQYFDVHDFIYVQCKSWLQYDHSKPAGSDYDIPLDDIDIYFRSSGNHWAAETHYICGQTENILQDGIYHDTYRHLDYINVRDKTADDVFAANDGKIRNEKQALDSLFKTKADLDPSTHKLLLSQLPDTIAGGWDYQTTWPYHRLPTAADKTSVDTDESHYHDQEQLLVKGDYWCFTGNEWDITELVKDSTIISYGSFENDTHYAIKNGDLLVYNGEGKWGVVDNTEEFIGFTSESVNISGSENKVEVPTGTDSKDVIDGILRLVDSKRETTGTPEVIITRSGNYVTYGNPESALVPEQADVNYFYKEKGHKELIKTGVSEFDDKLDIEEPTATISLHNAQERVNITTQLKSGVTDNTDGTVNVNTPTHSGTLMVTEDIFTEHEDDRLLRYETDKWGNPIAVKSNITDTDEKLKIEESAGLIEFTNSQQTANIQLNKQLKDEIEVKLPTHSGTIGTQEDLVDNVTDATLPIKFQNLDGTKSYFDSGVSEERANSDDKPKSLNVVNIDGRINLQSSKHLEHISVPLSYADGGTEGSVTFPNHNGTLGVYEDTFKSGADLKVPVYDFTNPEVPLLKESTITDDGKIITIENSGEIDLKSSGYEADLKVNGAQLSEKIELVLPNHSGTLAIESNVFTEVDNAYIPVARTDDDGNCYFESSNLKLTKESTLQIENGKFELINSVASAQIVNENEDDVKLTLPSQSGALLMDNDTIWCGTWKKGKLVE